jgi:hypothetical protein
MSGKAWITFLLPGVWLLVSAVSGKVYQEEGIFGKMLLCKRRGDGECVTLLAQHIESFVASELSMFEEELDIRKLKSVMNALKSTEKLVDFALEKRLHAADVQHAPLHSASRQLLLQNDPCDACKPAAPCYSLACQSGKMVIALS